VEAHVATCDYCVDVVSFLLELEDSDIPDVPAALLSRVSHSRTRRPWWNIAFGWAPAAAAVAGIILVASVVLEHQPRVVETVSERPPSQRQSPAVSSPSTPDVQPATPLPVPESRSEEQILAMPRLLQPRPGAGVSRKDFSLRWTAVPNALYYDVRVTSPDGRLAWSSRVEGAQARVPADADLTTGTYFIWVRAHLPAGNLVRSQAVSVTVHN